MLENLIDAARATNSPVDWILATRRRNIANHPRHVLPAERLLTHGAPAGEARADADYDAAHTDERDQRGDGHPR